MEKSDGAMGKWNQFCEKVKPGFRKTGSVLQKIGYVIGQIFLWIYKLRKVIMAIPVVWLSLQLAAHNMDTLPELVGVFIRANGTYALAISRQMAVFSPLVITGVCLVLMFCSKKALYPWLISLLTLILPLFVRLSSFLPA